MSATSEDGPAARRDRLGRPLRDLRVSVTDRCNFRCGYCMPKEIFGPDYPYLPRHGILSFEEIHRVVRLARPHGVRKVRLTGGEPLIRRDLVKLVAMLAAEAGLEIAVTTNGALLPDLAGELAASGVDRVTVSLDSLDDAVFRSMNDVDFPVSRVLDGIAAAERAGLTPVKVNCVVRRGWNEHTVVDLARHFQGSGHVVRFIEFMDVGTTNGWRLADVVPGPEIVRAISAEMPLEPAPAHYPGEVARRYRYVDGSGEVGIITSVTQPFCGGCTRARLSADGWLYTCLFANRGTDLRTPLRSGATDAEIGELLARVWAAREDRYSELRSAGTEGLPKVEMSYIGG